mgnify:CR=1 FL=1
MTEAGSLEMDDAIWHQGRVWWVATKGATGDVTFVDEPRPGDGQVTQLILEEHDEVTRASEALMDARGRHDKAVQRMRSHRYGRLDFEMAAERARKAMKEMETLNAAGIVAGLEL